MSRLVRMLKTRLHLYRKQPPLRVAHSAPCLMDTAVYQEEDAVKKDNTSVSTRGSSAAGSGFDGGITSNGDEDTRDPVEVVCYCGTIHQFVGIYLVYIIQFLISRFPMFSRTPACHILNTRRNSLPPLSLSIALTLNVTTILESCITVHTSTPCQ